MSGAYRTPLWETPHPTGLAYEDVLFPSRVNNMTLEGWYIPSKKAYTLIIVNGGIQNRVDPAIGTLELSKSLSERGFGLLLFDPQASRKSKGKRIPLIYLQRDVGGAVDYVKTRFPHTSIGLMGFSTGAAAAIAFASQEKCAAIVSESCFTSVKDGLITKINAAYNLPKIAARIIASTILLIARFVYHYKTADPLDSVARVACPILFIQGDADDLVPVSDAHKLIKASANNSDSLWIVPSTGHTQAYRTNPRKYVESVTKFFEGAEKTHQTQWTSSSNE